MQIISSRAENHKKHSYTPCEQKWIVGTPLKQAFGRIIFLIRRVPQQWNFIFSPIILCIYAQTGTDCHMEVHFAMNTC